MRTGAIERTRERMTGMGVNTTINPITLTMNDEIILFGNESQDHMISLEEDRQSQGVHEPGHAQNIILVIQPATRPC